MRKKKRKKEHCADCLEETIYGDYIRRHNGELCELGKLFEKIGCDFKFMIFAEFSKENSKCIDKFIKEELPTFQNRYSLTKYELFVGECHYEDEKKAYVKKIDYHNGLYMEESKLSFKAKLINILDNDNKHGWYIKFGNNPYCVQVYKNNGKNIVIHEKDLKKNGININNDYQIEYDMYIIDPKFYKELPKNKIKDKTGVQIISPEGIILNGNPIETKFLGTKNVNQYGSMSLMMWRCIVRVKDITLCMTAAEKYKTTISDVMKFCIRNMHRNMFIGKNLVEMTKYKVAGNNFQASNLPKTYEEDYKLDDGTLVKGINNYTKEELNDIWNKKNNTGAGTWGKKKKEKKSVKKKSVKKENLKQIKGNPIYC